jgi:hypothetical protein
MPSAAPIRSAERSNWPPSAATPARPSGQAPAAGLPPIRTPRTSASAHAVAALDGLCCARITSPSCASDHAAQKSARNARSGSRLSSSNVRARSRARTTCTSPRKAWIPSCSRGQDRARQTGVPYEIPVRMPGATRIYFLRVSFSVSLAGSHTALFSDWRRPAELRDYGVLKPRVRRGPRASFQVRSGHRSERSPQKAYRTLPY